jgi:DedD protein
LASRATVSDEEIQLRKRARRRLVGAIALVVVVVAAVPMLLDGEPKARTQQIEVHIPPVAAQEGSAAAPAPPPAAVAAPTPAPATAPAPAVAERAPEPQPAPPESVPPPAPAAPAAQKAGETPSKDGYVVQLIATTSPAKAQELRRKLERQRFPAYTEKTPDGGKTRVRVGPFGTREAAEQARQRLAKLDYDPGKVVRKGD